MTTFLLACIFLVVILFIGFQLIMSPAKLMWRLMINSMVGLISLLLVNYFTARYGFALPVNLVTVLIAGIFGIPGILGLMAWQIWM